MSRSTSENPSLRIRLGDGMTSATISISAARDRDVATGDGPICPDVESHNVRVVPGLDNTRRDEPILFVRGRDGSLRLFLLEETEYEVLVEWEGATDDTSELDTLGGYDRVIRIVRSSMRDHCYRINFRGFVGEGEFDVDIRGTRYSYPFEVRSRKMDYLSDYRTMLRDIASWSCSMVLDYSAPFHHGYDVSNTEGDSYEDFLVLEHLFNGPDDVVTAFETIRGDPHKVLVRDEGDAPSWSARDIDASRLPDMLWGGNLVPMDGGPVAGHVPVFVPVATAVIDYDTAENRLVRDFFERALETAHRLRSGPDGTCTVDRNRHIDETLDRIVSECEHVLSDPWFDGIGELDRVPSDSMVMSRREGYREIYDAYILMGSGTALPEPDIRNILRGHNKRLHQLYEYWCYIQIHRCLEELSVGWSEERRGDGDKPWMTRLKNVRAEFLVPTDGGRIARVVLHYNRPTVDDDRRSSLFSYSLALRPDFTLEIRSEDRTAVINLDSKYRLKPTYDPDGSLDDIPEGGCWETDLFKMHTYRDAMIWSYGSYVLYPRKDTGPGGCADRMYVKNVNSEDGYGIPSIGAVPLCPGDPVDRFRGFLMRAIRTVMNVLDGEIGVEYFDERNPLTDKR